MYKNKIIETIQPGNFEEERHYYPKVLNAQIHPLIKFLLSLDSERIISRYCHLHPTVDREFLRTTLAYKSKHLRWGGADLFNVTTESGHRKIVVVETNSCPSGQKSMPLYDEYSDQGGYGFIINESFKPMLKNKKLPKGSLAVIYDKNYMEASGYAAAMSDCFNEPVFLVPMFTDSSDHYKFEDGVLKINNNGEWISIKACLRYVTQKPWTRIPVVTKTAIYNPIVACLTGGRNKLMASKAYELYNADIMDSGLKIITPHTINDLSKLEVPLAIKSLGGMGVIKIPYSNAGQGVYTIVSDEELEAFNKLDLPYDQYIVQSLIGNYNWSSKSPEGQLYHVGTVPDKKNKRSFVADLRFMICSTPKGFRPVSIYARKAAKPLVDDLVNSQDSWGILGTNLSIKLGENKWDSDTARLVLMDRKDFNTLGLGLDDLIEAFIQTVLSVVAIDKMSIRMMNDKNKFRKKLFKSLNKDDALMNEVLI